MSSHGQVREETSENSHDFRGSRGLKIHTVFGPRGPGGRYERLFASTLIANACSDRPFGRFVPICHNVGARPRGARTATSGRADLPLYCSKGPGARPCGARGESDGSRRPTTAAIPRPRHREGVAGGRRIGYCLPLVLRRHVGADRPTGRSRDVATIQPGPVAILPKRRLPSVPPTQLSLADEYRTFERNKLPDEVQRYLAAVDEYRRLGSAPTWRAEVRP